MVPALRSSQGLFSCFGRWSLNCLVVFSICCILRYVNDVTSQVWNDLPGFLPSVSVSLCLITILCKVSLESLRLIEGTWLLSPACYHHPTFGFEKEEMNEVGKGSVKEDTLADLSLSTLLLCSHFPFKSMEEEEFTSIGRIPLAHHSLFTHIIFHFILLLLFKFRNWQE